MPDDIAQQMARAFVVSLSPICLFLTLWLGWKAWEWFRRM